MINRLSYYTRTEISLHLEDYHNAGLTPAETKEIIESIRDPFGFSKFYCWPGGINQNWSIKTDTSNPAFIEDIVFEIQIALDHAIQKRKKDKLKEKTGV